MSTTSKTTVNNLFERIAATKGRFFGLYLNDGQIVNAQYRSQSNSYLTVYDRACRMTRKFKKSSIKTATV